jgi:hypothetical protein
MTSIHVDLDSVEWTPGSAYKGPDARYQGQEVFYRKVLSDRRQEGGGLAVLSKICPPPGKMIKTVAVARSEEHVFNLREPVCIILPTRTVSVSTGTSVVWKACPPDVTYQLATDQKLPPPAAETPHWSTGWRIPKSCPVFWMPLNRNTTCPEFVPGACGTVHVVAKEVIEALAPLSHHA